MESWVGGREENRKSLNSLPFMYYFLEYEGGVAAINASEIELVRGEWWQQSCDVLQASRNILRVWVVSAGQMTPRRRAPPN